MRFAPGSVVVKAGRYGGTYAHTDLAMSFATWISPEFQLYIMKDYRRLKSDENSRLSLNWNLNREIAKLNYRIHIASARRGCTRLPAWRWRHGYKDSICAPLSSVTSLRQLGQVADIQRLRCADFFTADAGLWRQSDLCGGWHRQFQGLRKADDLRPFGGSGNRAGEHPSPDDGGPQTEGSSVTSLRQLGQVADIQRLQRPHLPDSQITQEDQSFRLRLCSSCPVSDGMPPMC